MRGRCIAVGVVVLGACANLPSLAPDVCGNGVVEIGEDCDGAVDATLGAELACVVAGSEHACRYTCSVARCPTGWGCGDDGVCRYGVGELVAGIELALPHVDLVIGELDDERGGELVAFGNAGVRVVGQSATTLVAGPDPYERPGAATDLDGDGRLDIVALLGYGIGVWRGEVDGALTGVGYAPFAAPTEAWFVPVRVPRVGDPDPNPDAIAVFKAIETSTGVEVLATPVSSGTTKVTDVSSPYGLGSIVVRADLDAPSPQDELVIASPGHREVEVIQPLLDATGRIRVVTQTLVLDEPSDGRIAAGDLDGDGDLDLVLGTSIASVFSLVTAINQGNLVFTIGLPTAPYDLGALAQPATLPGLQSGAQPFPLALGDVDADGVLDAVSPDAVFARRGTELVPIYRRPNLTAWQEAIITNLDRGAPDVIVADGPRLAVLRQGSGGFTLTAIDTAGSVTHLRAGDFDGDGIGDFAYRERTTLGDRVRVVFGADGPLSAPLTVVQGASIPRLEVGRLATGNGYYDAADELLAVVANGATQRAALIVGSGDRRLGSPLLLATASSIDLPLGATAGTFKGGSSTGRDLAIVARRNTEAQVWVFDAAPGAAFTSAASGFTRVQQLDGFAIRRIGALDRFGDGTDELVVFGVAARGATELVLVDVDGPTVVRVLEAGIGEPLDLATGDFDRDGRVELIAVGTRGVVLLRGDALEPLAFTGTSACIAQLDRDAALELVVLDGETLTIRDGADFAVRASLAAPAGAMLVRAGDLDGDGVDDLIVGDGYAVLPLLSRPQVPR